MVSLLRSSPAAVSEAGRAAVLRVDDNQYLLTSYSDLEEEEDTLI